MIDPSSSSLALYPDMKGRTAVVTGASQGIGAATVHMLREQGVHCFGLSRSQADEAAPDYTPIACDLTDVAQIEAACETIGKHCDSLDYVVNVAGWDPKYKIDEARVEDWDNLVALNLRGYYFVIQQALPLMRKGQGKAVVNISSINYRLGVPGRAIYSATKAGNLGLTTGLARELGAEGIRINTVTPGWTFTKRQVEEYFSGTKADEYLDVVYEHQALKLQVQPEDIAAHILFYLSAASRASTGHNCVVDGGWLLE